MTSRIKTDTIAPRSPGFARFKAHPKAEDVIADTIRLQQLALEEVSKARRAAGNPSEPPRKSKKPIKGATRRVLP